MCIPMHTHRHAPIKKMELNNKKKRNKKKKNQPSKQSSNQTSHIQVHDGFFFYIHTVYQVLLDSTVGADE